MYVSSQGVSVRSERTQDGSGYPERMVVAQFIDRDSLERGQEIINEKQNLRPDIGREHSEPSPTIERKSIIEEGLEQDAQKSFSDFFMRLDMERNRERAGNKLIEEAVLGMQSSDKAVRAEACEKISTVAREFPEIVPEEMLIKAVENLTNNGTTKSLSFLSSIPGITYDSLGNFEKLPAYPAHYYAKRALVSLGERSMPYLKQALVEGNRQMKEKVLEVLYEISLNNPELITDDFIPLLCKYASDEDYKAKDIIEVLIKSNRTSTSESAAESEDKE